jgi:uncharacterized protein
MNDFEDEYLCVGVCMADPDSGYCLGCGRPPLPLSTNDQRIVVEEQHMGLPRSPTADPDSPESAADDA